MLLEEVGRRAVGGADGFDVEQVCRSLEGHEQNRADDVAEDINSRPRGSTLHRILRFAWECR